MIKAGTEELKSSPFIHRLKGLMHVESCYSKIVQLLNKDSFPLSPNLCLWDFAERVAAGRRASLAVRYHGDSKTTSGHHG